MKTLLLTLLIIWSPILINAQTRDSLKLLNSKIENLEKLDLKRESEIFNINLRMEKYSIQNSNGNFLIISGIFISTLSTLIALQNTDNSRFRVGLTGATIGGLISTVGWGINLDSHNRLSEVPKHSRNRDRSYINSDGVKVNLR
jgi:hypothetical protein